MNWNNKNVLVTGAGGFIGSHLAEKLVSLGARTRALIHYNSSDSWGWLDYIPHKKNVEVVMGDIGDIDTVQEAMKGAEIVFHLAALIAIPYSYRAPASYVRTNVEGTLNILRAAKNKNVNLILHTSTSEVYGTALYVPIDEKHPLQGQSPYSASKIGADKIVESFNLSFGLPTVTIRPFNTFGPRQSARAVIPSIISQCLKDGKIHIGNVTPTRDFNFVANIVDGYIRATEAPNAVGKTINLGSGREISIENLIRMIAEFTGSSIEIEQEQKRFRPANSEVGRLLADNTLARELLDWNPSVSLEDGLKITIEWMKNNLDNFRPGSYAV